MHFIIVPMSISELSHHVFPNQRETKICFASQIPIHNILVLVGCIYASHLTGLKGKHMFGGYILFLSIFTSNNLC